MFLILWFFFLYYWLFLLQFIFIFNLFLFWSFLFKLYFLKSRFRYLLILYLIFRPFLDINSLWFNLWLLCLLTFIILMLRQMRIILWFWLNFFHLSIKFRLIFFFYHFFSFLYLQWRLLFNFLFFLSKPRFNVTFVLNIWFSHQFFVFPNERIFVIVILFFIFLLNQNVSLFFIYLAILWSDNLLTKFRLNFNFSLKKFHKKISNREISVFIWFFDWNYGFSFCLCSFSFPWSDQRLFQLFLLHIFAFTVN